MTISVGDTLPAGQLLQMGANGGETVDLATKLKGRKVVIETTVFAGDVATARGEVVAIQMPESFGS